MTIGQRMDHRSGSDQKRVDGLLLSARTGSYAAFLELDELLSLGSVMPTAWGEAVVYPPNDTTSTPADRPGAAEGVHEAPEETR